MFIFKTKYASRNDRKFANLKKIKKTYNKQQTQARNAVIRRGSNDLGAQISFK